MSLTTMSNKILLTTTEQVLNAPTTNNSMSPPFKIIICIISGLIATILLVFTIVYAFKRYKSSKNRALSEIDNVTEDTEEQFEETNEITSISKQNSFKVLLIYTYDCEDHFNVIKAFGHFLREICKLTVYFDYLEEEEIKTIGIEAWLDEHLESCTYVLIIWSIGARIKCSSKLNTMNFDDYTGLENTNNNLTFSKLINDSFFNHAINNILKTTKQQETNNSKYLNIYFDYSNKNDISYKFDSFKQYKLMFDIKLFLQHIFSTQNFSIISNYLKIIIDDDNTVKLLNADDRKTNIKNRKYFDYNTQQNESLLERKPEELRENLNDLKLIYIDQLYKQINNTKNSFKLNPNWFENSLFKNNKNSSALSLDSCLLNFETNNNKLISLSSKSSLESIIIPRRNNNKISSSPSLISFHSNCKNSCSNPYSDFFVHPLPSSIDINYFNLIEEKLNNTNNNNNNNTMILQNNSLIS